MTKQPWENFLYVAPSSRRKEWHAALQAGDATGVAGLIGSEPPGVAVLELTRFIHEQYRMAYGQPAYEMPARFRAARAHQALAEVRRDLGWRQREADVGVLRWLRKETKLSLVLGAGVTMDAQGPSWPALVRQLLLIALGKEHEIAEVLPDPDGRLGADRYVLRTVPVPPLAPETEQEARDVLAHIEAEGARSDTERLMHGAQICSDLFGQQLFKHLTDILYTSAPRPGPIHEAVAELASRPRVLDSGTYPAWAAIVSYNFDGLMCDALSDRQVPYAVWAVHGGDVALYRDPLAESAVWHQPILHVHGFTPSWAMEITHLRFVFSTSQYLEAYDKERPLLIGELRKRILDRPPNVALYVGCSFVDEAMNGLLRQAHERYMGRMHYALLRWPEARGGVEPSAEEIEQRSIPYLVKGVQPVWFDDFAEIPAILRLLE